MTTPDDLDRLETLLREGTPGSWRLVDERDSEGYGNVYVMHPGGAYGAVMFGNQNDTVLCVAAVDALPELLRLARLGLAAEAEKGATNGTA